MRLLVPWYVMVPCDSHAFQGGKLHAHRSSPTRAQVLCHTRELAYQICNEFERFSRYLPDIKTKVFYGGVPVAEHKRILKSECPHIIVGTPGRVLQLVREKELATKGISMQHQHLPIHAYFFVSWPTSTPMACSVCWRSGAKMAGGSATALSSCRLAVVVGA